MSSSGQRRRAALLLGLAVDTSGWFGRIVAIRPILDHSPVFAPGDDLDRNSGIYRDGEVPFDSEFGVSEPV